jgi:hypothetical protein
VILPQTGLRIRMPERPGEKQNPLVFQGKKEPFSLWGRFLPTRKSEEPGVFCRYSALISANSS